MLGTGYCWVLSSWQHAFVLALNLLPQLTFTIQTRKMGRQFIITYYSLMLYIAYLLIDEITSVNLVSINYMTYIYHVVQALGD